MIRMLRSFIPAVIAFAVAAPVVAAESHVVGPELWDRPRSSTLVMGEPGVRAAVQAWLAQPSSRLTIRYAGGAERALYAEELRAWLVALAVEPQQIVLQADLPAGSPMRMELTQ